MPRLKVRVKRADVGVIAHEDGLMSVLIFLIVAVPRKPVPLTRLFGTRMSDA